MRTLTPRVYKPRPKPTAPMLRCSLCGGRSRSCVTADRSGWEPDWRKRITAGDTICSRHRIVDEAPQRLTQEQVDAAWAAIQRNIAGPQSF